MENLFKNTNLDINNIGKITSYKAKTIIKNENEECNGIYIILNGEVNISTLTLTGNEYSIKVLKKNDIFGTLLLFSSNPYFLGNVICIRETQILFISKNKIIELMSTNNIFLNNFLNIIADKALLIQNKVKVLSQKTIRDKILFYFKENALNLHIYIKSKEIMAKELNIPRPSLSRELIKMKNEGLIKIINKDIYINKDII